MLVHLGECDSAWLKHGHMGLATCTHMLQVFRAWLLNPLCPGLQGLATGTPVAQQSPSREIMLFSHFRLELANYHVPAAWQLSAGRSIAMRLPSGTNVNSGVHCNESLHYYRNASSVVYDE